MQNGTKERSIRTRAKNSPKLSPKVKRIVETEEVGNKVNEQVTMPATKPFSAGSGIPKPTAAVKGTAKVVKKPSATEETPVLERTPGDGKEVPTASNKTSCKSEMDPSVETAPSLHDSNLSGNSSTIARRETALSSQVAVKCSSGTDSVPTRTIRLPSIADRSEPSSQHQPSTPGHISGVVEQGNQQENPMEKGASGTKPSVADQPEDCKPPRSTSSSFVAKVLPMTTGDQEKNSSDAANCEPNGQCQDDEEDESMNIQPMTIFSGNKSLGGKRHEYTPGLHESPAAVKRAVNTSYADPLDGYLSEGGASLYARKLHYLAVTQRNKEEDR